MEDDDAQGQEQDGPEDDFLDSSHLEAYLEGNAPPEYGSARGSDDDDPPDDDDDDKGDDDAPPDDSDDSDTDADRDGDDADDGSFIDDLDEDTGELFAGDFTEGDPDEGGDDADGEDDDASGDDDAQGDDADGDDADADGDEGLSAEQLATIKKSPELRKAYGLMRRQFTQRMQEVSETDRETRALKKVYDEWHEKSETPEGVVEMVSDLWSRRPDLAAESFVVLGESQDRTNFMLHLAQKDPKGFEKVTNTLKEWDENPQTRETWEWEQKTRAQQQELDRQRADLQRVRFNHDVDRIENRVRRELRRRGVHNDYHSHIVQELHGVLLEHVDKRTGSVDLPQAVERKFVGEAHERIRNLEKIAERRASSAAAAKSQRRAKRRAKKASGRRRGGPRAAARSTPRRRSKPADREKQLDEASDEEQFKHFLRSRRET